MENQTCTSLIFFGDQAINKAINTRTGYIKRFYNYKGEHVRKIQRVLGLFWELELAESPQGSLWLVDPPGKGIYGKDTHANVVLYQNRFDLYNSSGRADGICGPVTLKHMDDFWRTNRPFHAGLSPVTGLPF